MGAITRSVGASGVNKPTDVTDKSSSFSTRSRRPRAVRRPHVRQAERSCRRARPEPDAGRDGIAHRRHARAGHSPDLALGRRALHHRIHLQRVEAAHLRAGAVAGVHRGRLPQAFQVDPGCLEEGCGASQHQGLHAGQRQDLPARHPREPPRHPGRRAQSFQVRPDHRSDRRGRQGLRRQHPGLARLQQLDARAQLPGASGADPAHIPEWATNDPPISGKVAPGAGATFGKTGYDLQTPENAIHNAAAYASLAAHVARGKDERFGDGRQTE
jgi:hypothetical protein